MHWRAGRQRTVVWWTGVLFAIGSACFLVAPFPGFVELVGSSVDGVVFFVGSIFFTSAASLQAVTAVDRLDRWSSLIQFAGTIFFNVSTFRALQSGLDATAYDRLVWSPDALGSICFLISGAIAYLASPRHGWRPAREGPGWWQPAVNLLGCIFFGISAVAGYVVPSKGSVLDLAAANWNTSLGAACFLACALGTLFGAPAGSTHTVTFGADPDMMGADGRELSPR